MFSMNKIISFWGVLVASTIIMLIYRTLNTPPDIVSYLRCSSKYYYFDISLCHHFGLWKSETVKAINVFIIGRQK